MVSKPLSLCSPVRRTFCVFLLEHTWFLLSVHQHVLHEVNTPFGCVKTRKTLNCAAYRDARIRFENCWVSHGSSWATAPFGARYQNPNELSGETWVGCQHVRVCFPDSLRQRSRFAPFRGAWAQLVSHKWSCRWGSHQVERRHVSSTRTAFLKWLRLIRIKLWG